MILTIFLAIFLVILTFLFHYRMLLWLSVFIPYPNFPAQARVLFIVTTLFLAHIIEGLMPRFSIRYLRFTASSRKTRRIFNNVARKTQFILRQRRLGHQTKT